MKSLDGAVAVVVGGAGGIGSAIGRRLGLGGAHVVLADVDRDRAAEASVALGERGHAEAVDVTRPEELHALVERVVDRFGRLDVWCNSAGCGVAASFDQVPEDAWHRMVDVNLWGVVHGLQAAYPVLRRQGSGHLVTVSSVAGLVPLPLLAAYATTKHAVVGLSTSLRIEARRHGVQVHTICPGPVSTPMLDSEPPPGVGGTDAVDVRRYLTSLAGTPCSPDDVGEAVVRAVRRGRAVSVLPARARAVWRLQRMAPGLVAAVAGRAVRRELSLERAPAGRAD